MVEFFYSLHEALVNNSFLDPTTFNLFIFQGGKAAPIPAKPSQPPQPPQPPQPQAKPPLPKIPPGIQMIRRTTGPAPIQAPPPPVQQQQQQLQQHQHQQQQQFRQVR
jgi:hypothetical protein